MRFESSFGDGRRSMSSVAERIPKSQYETAHRNLEQKKISMNDFTDLYGSESIARDQAYVARRQAQFKEEETKVTPDKLTFGEIKRVSECAEDIIITGIESGWMPDTNAIKTTDFDDIANGVDFILERQKGHDPASHLGLAVDITCAKSMDEKFYRIKEGIDAGKLPSIKYFKSGPFKGQLSNVPKVVAAIDIAAVEVLTKERARGADLSKHTVRLVLLKQFEMQLEALTQYTQRARPELASHFATARETVRAMVSDLAPEMQKYAHIFGDHPTLIAMKAKLVEIFAARSGVPKTARILQSN